MNTGNTQSKRGEEIESKESLKQTYPNGDKAEYKKSLKYGVISFLLTLVFWGSVIYLISLI